MTISPYLSPFVTQRFTPAFSVLNQPQFGLNRHIKHSVETLERWDKFRAKKPQEIAELALSRLPKLGAEALIGFTIAVKKRRRTIGANAIPQFIPVLLKAIDGPSLATSATPTSESIEQALKDASTLPKPWRRQSPTIQTLASLSNRGYSIQGLTTALHIRSADVTRARNRVGLAPTTESTRTALANKAHAAKLKKLSDIELLRLLNIKGFEDSAISVERRQAFLALPALTQQVFRLATCLQNEAKAKKQPSDQAIANALRQGDTLPLSRGAVRRHLDTAREALQIELELNEQYTPGFAKNIRNKERLQQLSPDFLELPTNWKPRAKIKEVEAAKLAFKSLESCPLQRIVFTMRCRHPNMPEKELVTLIREKCQIEINTGSFRRALTLTRDTLGLTTKAGSQKTETAAAKKVFAEKLPKDLPQLGGTLSYTNPDAAMKIWANENSQIKLSDTQKAAFCAFAIASNEPVSTELTANQPVDMARVVAIYKDLTTLERAPEALKLLIRSTRKKLGLASSGLAEKIQAVEQFNKKASQFMRELPEYWEWGGYNGSTTKLKESEAKKRFRALPPLQRIIFTFCCVLASQRQKTTPRSIYEYALAQCKAFPKHFDAALVASLMYRARKSLGFQ